MSPVNGGLGALALTRVAHIITASRIVGGVETLFARLIPALQRSGLEQLALVRPGGDLAAHLARSGVPVLEYALEKRNLRSWLGVRRAFRRFAPDVALSWLPRAAQRVPPGPWVHVAQVCWYRGLDCYESAERMIVPNPDMVRHFASLGFKGEITALPHHFAAFEPAPRVERAMLDTPETVPIVLGLGRFEPHKGFDLAVEAVARLPHAWLWLAGEGSEEQRLRYFAEQLGVADRVRFLGWRRDVGALMGAASVVLVPSRMEALSLVILEAWARDMPVVAAASPGPRYLIEHDRSGLLVPVENAAALAEGIARVIEDRALAARLVEGGRRRLAEDFTEQATVRAYLDYFARVARASLKGPGFGDATENAAVSHRKDSHQGCQRS